MKKLKCKSCSKVWYVEDMEQDSQTSCPFCGESIKKEIQFDNIDSFDKAIYATVKMAGIDILKTPSKLSAYMMDTAPNFKNEIRFILKNISSKYANDIFKAFSDDTQDVNEIFFRIRQRLIDEDLASEKWTDIVCNSFKNASLMIRGINPHVVMCGEIKDIPVEFEPTVSKPKPAVNNHSSSNVLGSYKQTISKPKPIINNYSLLDIFDRSKCGSNAFWKLLKDGTLIIEGSGNMYDYKWNNNFFTKADWNRDRDKIKKVEIGTGIINIGEHAFYRCSSLLSVKLPDSLQTIGKYAFWDCKSLSSVKLPDNLQTVGYYAFHGCSSLLSVKLPDNLQTVESEAFGDCKSLLSVKLPGNLQTLGRGVFIGCVSLKEIRIPTKARKNMDNWDGHWKDGCDAKIIYEV